jgi:acylpyruvate hydrolase
MKIICIGRNYAEHAKELNNDLPEEPLFFLKPDTALLKEQDFYYPKFTNDLHYECEIVVKIDKVGKNIDLNFATKYYSEITLGIDFTARDLQQKCKEKGLPWEKAKGFDNSAPISSKWIKLSDINFNSSEFYFYQNDVLKQHGFTRDMIFSIDQIIAHISKYITLKTGDLIFTGTPSGVGPVAIGDSLKGKLNNEEMFTFFVK